MLEKFKFTKGSKAQETLKQDHEVLESNNIDHVGVFRASAQEAFLLVEAKDRFKAVKLIEPNHGPKQLDWPVIPPDPNNPAASYSWNYKQEPKRTVLQENNPYPITERTPDMTMKPRAVELVTLLQKARDAYYKAADPIMSDAEYDALEKELRTIVAKEPELAAVATPILDKVGSDTNGGRTKHAVPMLSIENFYSKEEIVEWAKKKGILSLAVEPKRDGISCSLKYVAGKLEQALTRGDGESGEDITKQVMAVNSIPKKLPAEAPYNVEVRGELVMSVPTFERINAELTAKGQKSYSSPRNLSAGSMKLLDVVVVASRNIEFCPWDLLADGLVDSHAARMSVLYDWGFAPYDGIELHRDALSKLVSTIDKILEDNAKSDIQADGVVVKCSSHKRRKELGVASKFTNWQCCYKAQNDTGESYIDEVVWQAGRSGKLTPVAVINPPLTLAGAVIQRIGINNSTWIEQMGLRLKGRVSVVRSGGVIPIITKALGGGTPIQDPVVCPECGKPVERFKDGSSLIVTLWCNNPICPGKVRDLFAFVGSREVLEVDGLGDEISDKLVRENYAVDLGELFEFQSECLEAIKQHGEDKFAAGMAKRGFSGAQLLKMVKSMETAKRASWDRWIAALAIPMVSGTIGRNLAMALALTADDMGKLPELLVTKVLDSAFFVEGIGTNKREAISAWIRGGGKDLCLKLAQQGVRPTPLVKPDNTGKPLEGIVFCITGEFPRFGSRPDIEKKLSSVGAVAKSSVTKKVNLLLVGSEPGRTKLEAAAKLGVKREDETWLKQVYQDNGFNTQPAFEAEEA